MLRSFQNFALAIIYGHVERDELNIL